MIPAVYVGQTRSKKLIEELNGLGFGEMTVRAEYPPRRTPWAFDNGAFGDWKAKRVFDGNAFWSAYRQIHGSPAPPDFVVCPDIVAGGLASLDFSLQWAATLTDYPLYLAVQDGMEPEDVRPHLRRFAGLFVGGTLGWKIRTAGVWVRLAQRSGRRCHIGRCGTARRVAWAIRLGADSIDSALPLWSRENLRSFLRGLSHSQRELALGEAA